MSDTASKMPHILHVAPAYFPAIIYGGPTFSTMALCDGLAQSGTVSVRVLSTDSNGKKVSQRVEVESNPLPFDAGYDVYYCRRIALNSLSTGFLMRLPGYMRKADLVHLTSTYSFTTIPTLLLARMMGKPVVWSPRGSLQATAQWDNAPKRGLKRQFEKLCQLVRPSGTVLLVTAPLEAELSCSNLPGIATSVIPNIIDLPEKMPERTWRPEGKLRLMFISRLHPKKGIELLLSAVAKLPDHVSLDIYGSGTPEYEDHLRNMTQELGITDRVTFRGYADGDAKAEAFRSADIMCLPTHSENFGIVVGEALAHGVPAITTTEAPWAGLETENCGRWIERSEEALLEAITDLEQADLPAMGQRGRAWIERDFSSRGVIRSLLKVYGKLLARSTGQNADSLSEAAFSNE